jgi:hypothetical protein
VGASRQYFIEHLINGEYVEFEYEIECDSYEPYVPAQISGPPENCYPAEGGYATADTGSVRRRPTQNKDAKWEHVLFSVFLEAIVEERNLKDDPPDKKYRKTALQKAESQIEDELFEAAEDAERAAYEDAMEARAEARRERDWDFGGDY